VAGVIPWRLTRWKVRQPVPGGVGVRALGAVLIAGGAVGMTHSFVRFVVEGLGTPLLVAPPQRLVVGGVYRHVRNPMYLAGEAAILGQAMLLGQPVLLLYGASAAVPVVAFVRYYEEPTMLKTFGAEYEDYRRNVPGGRNSARGVRGRKVRWRGPFWKYQASRPTDGVQLPDLGEARPRLLSATQPDRCRRGADCVPVSPTEREFRSLDRREPAE